MLNMGMGVPMEMLPPGEQYRRQFDRSLMGLEMMSGGGGDGGAAESRSDQHRYNMLKYEYDNEQLTRQRDESIRLNQIKRDELEVSIARQNKMGQDNADYALANHNFQFDNQMKAFVKSEALCGRGLDLVQKNQEQQLH